MCISRFATPSEVMTLPLSSSSSSQQQQQQQKEQPHRRRYSSKSRKTLHPHITVQHNYHDYANAPAPLIDHYAALAKSGTNTSFPMRLYDMLDRVEQEGFGHIVSWQPHGRCFVVHRADDFEKLLPKYFKLSKIPSFQRQLNLYGFLRLTAGKDRGGYYHECFLRGKPFLMERLHRAKVKGTVVRARSNPKQEPDFYAMSWVGCDNADAENDVPCVPLSAAARTRETSSSSSVVSFDGNTDEFEPIPLSAIVTPSQSPQQQFDENDIVLSGWGMPFHYMGDLPQEIVDTVPEPVPITSSSSAPSTSNVIDPDDFDSILDGLLNDNSGSAVDVVMI